MFTSQPGGKATSVLGIVCDGFGREIWAQVQLPLPDGNLIPHDSSLLSAQLYYRRSFWRDNTNNSADNIPQVGRNCADNPSLRHSSTNRVYLLPTSALRLVLNDAFLNGGVETRSSLDNELQG
jgi:hypothetical protein